MKRGAGHRNSASLPALLPFLLVAVPVPADCPRRSAVEAFLTGYVAVPGQTGAGRQPVPL